MNWQYAIVYIVFTLLLSVVFEIIDRVVKKISDKIKAKRVSEVEKANSDEGV